MERVYIGLLPGNVLSSGHYAVLDAEQRLILDGRARWDELPGVVARYPAATVAVAAPLGPSLGLLRNGAGAGRVAEHELIRRGIPLPFTPRTAAEASPAVQTAWQLIDALREMGVIDYQPERNRAWLLLEANPTATAAALLGRVPLDRDSLEGRMQRQLLLAQEGLNVPDAMTVFESLTRHRLMRGEIDLSPLYGPTVLDVLLTALTAWYAGCRSAAISRVGHSDEGLIVVPTPHLKARYG